MGSQSPDQKYFEFHSNTTKCVPPSMPVAEVDRQTLYMAECDVPPSISDKVDGATVEFRGFGQLLNCRGDTVQNLGLECIVDQLPEHLMAGDSSSGDDTVADGYTGQVYHTIMMLFLLCPLKKTRHSLV